MGADRLLFQRAGVQRELADTGDRGRSNFATLLFTSMLKKGLEPLGVPLLSLLDLMLLENGRTDTRYLRDGCHLSQAAMPYALALVEKHLGLSLRPLANNGKHPDFIEEDITRRAEVRQTERFDRLWTVFSFEAALPLASYLIAGPALYGPEAP